MRADVKWTNLSRRQIAQGMMDLGTPVSKNVVSRLLWNEGHRRRNSQMKRTMGQHADRNARNTIRSNIKSSLMSLSLAKGVPLEDLAMTKHYMEKTATTQRLNVVVCILEKVYQTGR
jgi:hypothetical protein